MIPETSNLKACPFCGKEPELIKCSGYDEAHCINDNCELSHTHVPINLSRLGWQSRPIEDALTARIAELEKRNARLEQAWDEIKIIADKLYNHLVLDHKSNLESVQLSIRDDIREYENIVTAWQRAKEGKE